MVNRIYSRLREPKREIVQPRGNPFDPQLTQMCVFLSMRLLGTCNLFQVNRHYQFQGSQVKMRHFQKFDSLFDDMF